MENANAKEYDFIKEEYFKLHDIVVGFDEKVITIKSWSVTTSMAGVAAAFIEKRSELLLLASVASLLFWIIEALWKSFQRAHYRRIRQIEQYLSPTSPSKKPFHYPRITSSWHYSWSKDKSNTFLRILFSMPHVYLPHAAVMIGGILLWLLNLKMKFICP